MQQFVKGAIASCCLTGVITVGLAFGLVFGLAFSPNAQARPVYPESDMATAVAICRADWQCIDHIQAAFCKVGMEKELDAVDQAGYQIVATQKMGAISDRNAIENAFDKYRKKLAGGGISENDCQLIITAARKATADLNAIFNRYR